MVLSSYPRILQLQHQKSLLWGLPLLVSEDHSNGNGSNRIPLYVWPDESPVAGNCLSIYYQYISANFSFRSKGVNQPASICWNKMRRLLSSVLISRDFRNRYLSYILLIDINTGDLQNRWHIQCDVFTIATSVTSVKNKDVFYPCFCKMTIIWVNMQYEFEAIADITQQHKITTHPVYISCEAVHIQLASLYAPKGIGIATRSFDILYSLSTPVIMT